jgi:hypothetical protein
MDFKPVAKSILREEIKRLHAETVALYQTMDKAQLPSDESLDNMKQDIFYAAESFREAGIALKRVEEKFTDAFDPTDI